MNLLENVYLPDFKKRQIRDSDAYKLLEKNGMDTSPLEGNYEEKAIDVKMKDFDSYINEGGTKEDWVALHADKETQKEFFGTIGDFLVDTGKDTVLSLGVAAINGADVATNLMPVVAKVLDNSPLVTMMPNGFMNAETEEQVYNAARIASENLGQARDYLKSFKEDDNIVSQLIGVLGQDLVYSVPMFKALRNAGVPQYPAFFISGGVGGAIGIEEKVLGEDSTFSKSLFAKDIKALKDLVGILPNTPEDKIADEVVQALEYGAFSTVIPAVIDSFKFMKRYIPAFAGGAAITTMSGDDAEANPIKAITNAVKNVPIFKSAVRDAAEKKITKGNAEQIYNTIKNTPGVKESELKWLGLEDHLKTFGKANKKQFTQEEVLEFIDNNKIDITEVKFGGDAARLSDDLEEKINRFEMRYLDSFEDPTYPNYDVYPFQRMLADNDGISSDLKESLSLDYDQLSRIFEGFPINSTKFIEDFTIPSGKIEVHAMIDQLNNQQVYVGKDLAEELINEKEMLPAAINGSSFRYRRQRVLEFEPLDIEKFLIERERRIFMNTKSAPKFERFTEPGGAEYTELVFKIKKGGMDLGIPVEIRNAETTTIKNNPFRSPNHMDVKNEIAHVRFKSRDFDGKEILTVEEMQSDFNIRAAQENRAFAGEKPKIADFPFKNTWYEMTIRRLIRYAADNNFDAVAIPKGNVPAKRYGESINKLASIEAVPNGPGSARITFTDDTGKTFNTVNFNPSFSEDNEIFFRTLEKYRKDVGPKRFAEFQQMIMNATDDDAVEGVMKYDKAEIIGSGKGKFELYDKAIPAYMKKYAKKWNAKVYDDVIEDKGKVKLYREGPTEYTKETNIPVTIIEVTPEMKKSVQGTPQPLFSYFGGTVLGAELVSDTIQNNIISDQTN